MFREQNDLPIGVERVLIVGGAGGVGSIATQLLKAETSALVISTASRPESRVWCHEMGADLVIDHSKDLPEQLSAEHIEKVDMIRSTAKTADNLSWIAKLLRPFGHLSVIDMSPSLNANALMLKSASLHTEKVFLTPPSSRFCLIPCCRASISTRFSSIRNKSRLITGQQVALHQTHGGSRTNSG